MAPPTKAKFAASSAKAVCNTCEVSDVTSKILCGKCKWWHPKCNGCPLGSYSDINSGFLKCQECLDPVDRDLSENVTMRIEIASGGMTTESTRMKPIVSQQNDAPQKKSKKVPDSMLKNKDNSDLSTYIVRLTLIPLSLRLQVLALTMITRHKRRY